MKDKLQEILKIATNNSPFYSLEAKKFLNLREFYSNFKLTKPIVIENMYDIISKKYNGNLYKSMQVNTTSGTSGIPVRIMWEQNDLMRSNLSIWRLRKKYYDVSPHDVYCTLHTVSYFGSRINKLEKIILNNNIISFCKLIQDDDTMLEYYNVMIKYKPKWLLFQPSFALKLVNFCREHNLAVISSVKYIEFTGELLTESTRAQVVAFFNCATANMYGCMEINSVAYECPYGTMHVLEDNVAIETDENKNVYLTSLNNTAFPLIKYEVGDKIELNKHYTCGCGVMGMTITKIIGRSSRQINLSNGNILNEAMIAYCIERAESVVGIGLKQYRAVYNNGVLTVEIVCSNANDRWRSVFSNEAVNQFIALCNFVDINFVFVDMINRTKNEQITGKYSILEVEE